jgi:hypothetical protein
MRGKGLGLCTDTVKRNPLIGEKREGGRELGVCKVLTVLYKNATPRDVKAAGKENWALLISVQFSWTCAPS